MTMNIFSDPDDSEKIIFEFEMKPAPFHYPIADMFGNITNWLPYRPRPSITSPNVERLPDERQADDE